MRSNTNPTIITAAALRVGHLLAGPAGFEQVAAVQLENGCMFATVRRADGSLYTHPYDTVGRHAERVAVWGVA